MTPCDRRSGSGRRKRSATATSPSTFHAERRPLLLLSAISTNTNKVQHTSLQIIRRQNQPTAYHQTKQNPSTSAITMAVEISISGWPKQWLQRELTSLHCETMMVVYAITFISLFIGVRALLRVRRCRKELEAEPSDRAAIIARSDKQLHKSTKTMFFLSHIYLIHSLALWAIDAGIGVSLLFQDVNKRPEDYTPTVWLDVAIQTTSMLAIFSAVFLIFPMLQIIGVAYIVKKSSPKNGDGTLSAYISEGRIVTTHLAQLWLTIGFCVVAWWPVFEMTVARLIVLEAVFGSGLAWLNASFAFNFRSETLCKVRTEQAFGVRGHAKIYGKQAMAVYGEKEALLPKYEETAQNEKTESWVRLSEGVNANDYLDE